MRLKHIWVDLDLFDGEGAGEGTSGESSESATPSDAETDTGEEEESDADSEPTEEERRQAYDELIKEYKDFYTKDTQQMINRRFKETKNLEAQLNEYAPLMDILSQRYNVSDVQSAIKAMEDDNAYWEQLAYDAGMTVEQYKEVSKLRRENKALIKAQQQAQVDYQTEQQLMSWREQEAQMKELYSDFNLDYEIQNPDFARLLQSGVPVKTAYEVLHMDEIQDALMSYTAQRTAKQVADDIKANSSRPTENGASKGNAFTQKVDVSKLTNKEMDDYIRRAARGETVTFK